MKILVDVNSIVVACSNDITEIDAGYRLGNTIFGNGLDLRIIEVDTYPEDIIPSKYLYRNDSFVENPGYQRPNSELEKIIEEQDALIEELIISSLGGE